MKKASTLFLAMVVLFLANSSYLQGTNYYVSNTGNDGGAGTKAAPWKTVAKLNTITFQPGDSVFLEAGGVWRETLEIDQGATGAGKRVYYGRYNSGSNPKILGSNKGINWTATATSNVWVSGNNLANPEAGDWGFPGAVFFENGSTVKWGISKTYSAGYTNLVQEYDWTWNSNKLYIYSPSDPNTRYTSVEASQRDLCLEATNAACSYIEINGIDFFYARRAGFGYNGYPEEPNQKDLTFRNCTLGYIGVKGGAAAYGIEAFHSNFLVEKCTITDCGRRGISFNFYEEPATGHIMTVTNVVVRNNVFKRGYHTTSLDIAAASLLPGHSISNIYYYNNIVDDHEITMTGDDASSNQVYFQPYEAAFSNIYCYNNVFIQATARNILVTGGNGVYIWYNTIVGHNPNTASSPYGNVSLHNDAVGGLINVDFRNNILYDNLPNNTLYNYGLLIDHSQTVLAYRDYNLYRQGVINAARRGFTGGYFGYYGTDKWAQFKTDYPTWEVHSPAPADPLFTDYATFNFTLQATSPAVAKGTPIATVTTDILGNARSATAPSLGAYEYVTGGPPVYMSSVINNATPSVLEMTYSLSLANIVPAASAFTVMVNSTARAVNSVSISGNKVLLTLSSAVAYGDNVTVAYTKPANNPIQTGAGDQATSITAQPVTNSVAQVLIPVYQSSIVTNTTPNILEMTYNQTLANVVPATSAFTVTVNGSARGVSSVSISGTKVLLTLASAVAYGDVVTVAYTKPASNPLQTPSGGQAVTIAAQPVTNSVGAPTPPVYQSAVVTNAAPTILEMTYNLSLANVVPATSAFTVLVNSASRGVTAVAISGTKVRLTLASAIVYGDVITVAYTKPATNPIQTAAGGQAATITAQPVTNSVGSTTVPVYQSSVVENATPTVVSATFSLALANVVPATSAFIVNVNGLPATISTVSISGTAVSITLSTPVAFGDLVTLTYVVPATNPLQASAGGNVPAFSDQAVTNNVEQQEVPLFGFKLYPNPTQGDFTVEITGDLPTGEVKVKILGLCGSFIYNSVIDQGVNLKNFPLKLNKGFYLVQFLSNGAIIAAEKLMVLY